MPQDNRARAHSKRRATKRLAMYKAAAAAAGTPAAKRTKKAKD